MSGEREALAGMSAHDLRAATQGCTELTCIYHHEYVAELRRRATEETP